MKNKKETQISDLIYLQNLNIVRDNFIQQSDRNLEIPHELIQERTDILRDQHNRILNDYITNWFNDLADWFEAERQIRQEIGNNNAIIGKRINEPSESYAIASGRI